YDGFHRRIAQTIENHHQREDIQFIYLDKLEIASLKNNKLFQLKILGLSNGSDTGSTIAIELDNEIYIPLHDLKGNIAQIISPKNGKVIESYIYSVFGKRKIFHKEKKEIKKSKIKNPWGYSCKRHEETLDLIFFGRRYYSPSQSRWITSDPSGYSDGINLYSFALNNPVSNIDHFGLFTEFKSKGVGSFFRSLFSFGKYFPSYKDFILPSFPSPLDYLGKFMELIGQHLLLPIPIIKKGIIICGRIIQFDFGPYDDLFEDKNLKLCNSINNRNYQDVYLFINGILNKEHAAKKSSHFIESMLQGRGRLMTVYLPTKGLIEDLHECGSIKMGYSTKNTRKLETLIEQTINEMPQEGTLHIIAHSKGALVTYKALTKLNKNLRNRITVDAFGTAKIIPKGFVKQANNFISRKDFVPWTNFIDITRGIFFKNADIHFLKCKRKHVLIDHRFQSLTYQTALENQVESYCDDENNIMNSSA
ncbi:MAG TPA: RHS repeat-associated core domain-containing protein, partial [Chlamydiales bacterium]|nr:RHS repeat-associated core domain-containing protein [Chlamydiales bacterium]